MAIAMLFSPEFSVGSIGVRAVSIRIEDVLIPILMMAWLSSLAIQKKSYALVRHNPLQKPIFCLLVLSVLASIYGVATGWCNFYTSAFYIGKTIEFFIIYALVVSYVQTEYQIKIFFGVTLFTVALLGFYTIWQVPSTRIFTEHRITAPFEGTPEPATVGGYMAFLLLIIFSIFLFEKKPARKWGYAVLGAITFIPFLFTLNRTSYAALVGGVIFIAIVVKKKWLSVLLISLAVLSPFWAPQAVRERIAFTWEDAKNPGRDMGIDYSSAERFHVFLKVWNTLKSNPISGLGVGSFDYPDNQYARTLHEIGFLGLGFWIWIFVRLMRSCSWLYDSLEDGFLKGAILGYRAGVIGILMHAFGAITFYIVRIMEPFWFVSGLVMSLYLLKLHEYKAKQ